MDTSKIAQEIEEFKAMAEQAAKEMKKKPSVATKPEAPDNPPPIEVPVAAEGGSSVPLPDGLCFNLAFKKMVFALNENYIGNNNAKFWLLDLPDCPE